MSTPLGMSRRELIELGAAGGLASALGGLVPACAIAAPRDASEPTVTNIIFMVADGMSLGVPSLVETFSRIVRSGGTRWFDLLMSSQTTLGYFETHSLNSLVTDSAAASSAWASGSRIVNGAINTFPDGTKLTPVAQIVKGIGKRIGLVTTTTITHATPAGFAACQASREDQHLIAPQYLDLVDVAMGGGRKHFDAAKRKDKSDVIARYTSGGYAFWDHRNQVIGSDRPQRVLGLFSDGHIPFTVDQLNSTELRERVPTLADMSRAALEILDHAPSGFLLQIEGGRVDHAAHSNDAAAIFWDQLAFDDAIGVVLEYVSKRDDTLVVITTDHGNSNPGLNGMGDEYGASTGAFERLALAKGSVEVMMPALQGGVSQLAADAARSAVIETVRANAGVEISAAQADRIAIAAAGKPVPADNLQHGNLEGVLGNVLSNYNGIGWTGVSHTADYAPILAVGAGRERFAGLLKNTDAFGRMLSLFGTEFKNPVMTADQARKARRALAPGVQVPHWI